MRHASRLTLLFAVAFLVSSCAAGVQSGTDRPRSSRDVITQAELAELQGQNTVLDVVRRLRSSWLRPRNPSETVRVYIDNVHAGDVDLLQTRPLEGITEIRYHNGRDATTSWGTGVGGGVIELITERR